MHRELTSCVSWRCAPRLVLSECWEVLEVSSPAVSKPLPLHSTPSRTTGHPFGHPLLVAPTHFESDIAQKHISKMHRVSTPCVSWRCAPRLVWSEHLWDLLLGNVENVAMVDLLHCHLFITPIAMFWFETPRFDYHAYCHSLKLCHQVHWLNISWSLIWFPTLEREVQPLLWWSRWQKQQTLPPKSSASKSFNLSQKFESWFKDMIW